MENAYQSWKQVQDQPSMLKLLEKAKPTIDSAIRTYVGQPDPVAHSKAKLLALKAFRSYDPKKGTKLRTHLMTQLQPLRRLAAQRRTVLQVPERVQQQMNTLFEAKQALVERFNREPSDIELADHTGLSVRRIQNLRQYQVMPIAEGVATTPEGKPIQAGVSQPSRLDAWTDYVYTDLPPTDKKIFEWRTGYGGKPILSNNEIARRLRLTPSAITQRSARIAKLLEKGIPRGPGNP